MPAVAVSVYRCTNAAGAVTFQDRTCGADESTRIIRLPDDPPRAVPEDPSTPRVADLPQLSLPGSADVSASPQPPSTGIVCLREDGSRYLSDSGLGERRAVPLAMLGLPSRSLADAYGGREGIGVSAPGLRDLPADTSRQGRIGALYTWIEDPCEELRGAPLCQFFDARIADAERRLRSAFSDTSAEIRDELSAWRRRAAGCRY